MEITKQTSKKLIFTDEFITLIKERPNIYKDVVGKSHKKNAKDNEWREIGEILFQCSDRPTVVRMKNRWKSMRDNFVRSYKYYLIKRKNNPYAKPPINLSKFSFLLPYIYPQKSNPNNSQNMDDLLHMLTTNEIIMQMDKEPDCDETSSIENTEEEIEDNKLFFLNLAKTVDKLKPTNQAIIREKIATIVLDFEIQEANESEQEMFKSETFLVE